MGSCESFDGLCGCIAPFASSDLQLRCKYFFDHDGECSWKKHQHYFHFTAGCDRGGYEKWLSNREDEDGVKRGFKDSVFASPNVDKLVHPIRVSSEGKTDKKK